MLIGVKEMSIRFAWEDWNERNSKRKSEVCRDRVESATRTRKLSSAAQKAAILTPAGQRSADQENRDRGRSVNSTGHHAGSDSMSARQLNGNQMADATLKSTASRRPSVKLVQSPDKENCGGSVYFAGHHARSDQMSARQLNGSPMADTTLKHASSRRPPVKLVQSPDQENRGGSVNSTCDHAGSDQMSARQLNGSPMADIALKSTGSRRPPVKSVQSPDQENHGRSVYSTGHHARPLQLSARLLNGTPMADTERFKHTSSRRRPVKSVQSRGTQLDSTPMQVVASIRSNVDHKSQLLRQLEETPMESTSLAWNHFRSFSVVGQTPNPEPMETAVAESSGNDADLFIGDVLSH